MYNETWLAVLAPCTSSSNSSRQVSHVLTLTSFRLQVLLSARASPEKLHDIVDVLSMHCITVSCCSNTMQQMGSKYSHD